MRTKRPATRRATRAMRVLLAIGLSVSAGCGLRGPADALRNRARASLLRQQIAGMRTIVARAERGEFAHSHRLVIAVSESVIQDIVNAQLPRRAVMREVLDVEIQKARVSCRATQTVVLLDARVRLAKGPETYVDALVTGGLDRMELNLRHGRLVGRVRLYQLEVSTQAASPLVRMVIEGIGEPGLKSLSDSLPVIEIPVRLEEEIQIPGFGDGPVVVDPGRLPLKVAVSDAFAFGERLWVLIDISVGKWQAQARSPSTAGQDQKAAARSGS
jgi:hypothetical protein